jgi:hypothetical protein
MKTLIATCVLILVVFTLCYAQEPTNIAVGNSVSFERGHMEPASATFGLYNMVTFTQRDCTKYSSYHRGGFLWLHQIHVIDNEACNADLSTIKKQWSHHNLTVDAGKNFIKAQVSGTGTTANCIFMAVGTSAVTPAAGDTTLTGEATTNGMYNGSNRWTGTYADTGTGTFTLSKTFTATGAVSNVQAAAVFTAGTSGTMCFEVGSLGPVSLATNDTLTVQWSGTIS